MLNSKIDMCEIVHIFPQMWVDNNQNLVLF